MNILLVYPEFPDTFWSFRHALKFVQKRASSQPLGLITVAQFGVGLLFGFGQFVFGSVVLAQFAGGLLVGVGQIATGYAAIGQVVLSYYGLGQIGLGKFLWTMSRRDGEAVRFFLSWGDYLKQLIN